MVDHKGETSNQLFSVLEEWKKVLQGLSKGIFTDNSKPGFLFQYNYKNYLKPDHVDPAFLTCNSPWQNQRELQVKVK